MTKKVSDKDVKKALEFLYGENERDDKSKATPTPWHIDRNSDGYLWLTDSKNNLGIARFSNPSEASDVANAAFIVRAVNSHDELLTALREALKFWDSIKYKTAITYDEEEYNLFDVEPGFVHAARSAIAKAEGLK